MNDTRRGFSAAQHEEAGMMLRKVEADLMALYSTLKRAYPNNDPRSGHARSALINVSGYLDQVRTDLAALYEREYPDTWKPDAYQHDRLQP